MAAGVARSSENHHAVSVVGDPPPVARRTAYPQALMKPQRKAERPLGGQQRSEVGAGFYQLPRWSNQTPAHSAVPTAYNSQVLDTA